MLSVHLALLAFVFLRLLVYFWVKVEVNGIASLML